MRFGLRFRLSLMMVLQYAVWSIWLNNLNQRLDKNDLKLDLGSIGDIFSVYGFGAILGPFILGQIADRYLATEKVLFLAHFVGGLLLIAAAYATTFWPIFLLLFAYCNLYMPTMGLTNSITFRALGPENQKDFPGIRLWGTIGWIAGAWAFTAYLDYKKLGFFDTMFSLVGLKSAFASLLVSWNQNVVPLMERMFANPWIGHPQFRDCLRLAGVLSIVYSFYCLVLPHTPPMPASAADPREKRSAIVQSLRLMRSRSFAVLIVIAGLIGIMLAFYFACENPFLESIGIKPEQAGAYMTIGQIAEIVVMIFVPFAVAKLGVKRTMIIGASAWALRFGLSAYGKPQWLMISTITLHGFAFGFFFVVAQMFVDRAAGANIKATAQSFLVVVVYGLGTVVGSGLAGRVRKLNTVNIDGKDVENWTGIWLGPFILTILCIIAFAVLFREERIGDTEPLERT
ncbi:MAG: hypothetical protein NVSMB14_05590 [Isosphaeraceae bacterium]